MNVTKIEAMARKAAEAARPGIEKIGGKIYTLVFDQKQWVYAVYEDGFFLVNFNTKKLPVAKKWLKEHVSL